MTRFGAAMTLGLVGSLGFVGGTTATAVQEPAMRLVALEFDIGPDQTPNEAITELSEWVRIARATGKHQSVKLYMHEWGPSASLHLIVETDWSGVEAFFVDLLEAKPDFMDQPFGFAGHRDNILTEIPVS